MQTRELTVAGSDGVLLAVHTSGEGPPVVLLHGLTATHRYVTMRSRTLERSGLRTIAYDARGHGGSSPAPVSDAYGYAHLSADLLSVLDRLGLERAVIAGASMGAHTAIRFALERPERVAALGLITPSYDPEEPPSQQALAGWDALAQGLRQGGVEGFIAAYDFATVLPAWRATVEKVVRQRLSAHAHPRAVADALEAVPRSRAFERIEQLRELAVPTLVVASRDEADPGHPLTVGERYARAIPGARLAVEDEGPPPCSPIAWQGGQLSKLLAELAQRAQTAGLLAPRGRGDHRMDP
jgi:pimeloyl-ACP methyl ester carboxylesterase